MPRMVATAGLEQKGIGVVLYIKGPSLFWGDPNGDASWENPPISEEERKVEVCLAMDSHDAGPCLKALGEEWHGCAKAAEGLTAA